MTALIRDITLIALLSFILIITPLGADIFNDAQDTSEGETAESGLDDLSVPIEESSTPAPAQAPKSYLMPSENAEPETLSTRSEPDYITHSSNPSPRATRWTGEKKIVVIATEFPDKAATASISSINNTVTTRMRSYYSEVSYDNFKVMGTVVNNSWLMMPNNITYYTENNKAKFGEYVRDAIEAADPIIDYDDFRSNSNRVELVILVHAGQDEATSGDPLDIWSHMSQINPKNVDNSFVTQYCTVSEFSPLGTYVHEFGHLLWLPDLYDKDYSSDGIGLWGLMAAGSHLNGGSTPAHLSAWSKYQLGWITPIVVTSNMFDVSILDVERNAVAYKIPIPITDVNSDEYFLVANRYRTGYDSYLPASGLLIWHVDDAKLTSFAPNNDENHKLLDVEESTPTQHLDNRADGNLGDSNDVWKDSPTGFTPQTDPDSDSYYGFSSKFYLENIGGSGSTMKADFIVRHIYVTVQGNSEQYADPGYDHTVKFNITSDRASGDTIDFTLFGVVNGDWASLKTAGVNVANENDIGEAEVVVSLPANEYPNIYCEFYILAHSSDDTVANSAHVKVIVDQYYAFHALEPPDLALDPGENTINLFKIFNDGNVKTSYEITIDHSSTWQIYFWAAADPYKVYPELKSQANQTIQIYVEVPQSALANEEEKVTITIISAGNNEQQQLSFKITVNEKYGLRLDHSLSSDEMTVEANSILNYEFLIVSEGNTEDDVSVIIAQDILAGEATPWSLTLTPSETITIQPDDGAYFYLKIEIPENAKANSKQSFKIKILSEDGDTNDTYEFSLTVNQFFGMNAVLDSSSKTIKPGEKVYYNFKITNTGNGNDTYNISVISELPEGWTFQYPSNIDETVGPGKTEKFSLVLISVPLTPANSYNIKIKIISLSDETITQTFSEDLEVERVHSVEITVQTGDVLKGAPGDRLNFTIQLENKGNDAETVMLSSSNIAIGHTIFKSSVQGDSITSIELLAGETKTLIVQLTIFNTVETEQNGAVQVKGTLEDESFTNEVPLLYKVEIDESTIDNQPDNGDSSSGSSSSVFGNTMAMIVIAIIIVVVVIVMILFLLITKKKKEEKDAQAKAQAKQQMQIMDAAVTPMPAEVVTVDPVTGYPMAPGGVMQGEPVMDMNGQLVSASPPADYNPNAVMGAPGEFPQLTQGEGAPEAEAPLRFDPQTGEPLTPMPQNAPEGSESVAPLRFDPQTGEPIEPEPEILEGEIVSEPEVPLRFDPQTGEPLTAGRIKRQ
ncbi:MAG: M6 family metalloprotease domain-containing protein [Thermoplasmata archaeon]|nr:MAG: M6 family metalloprotease domain-containing protein [Thermoplasmata archaeon]